MTIQYTYFLKKQCRFKKRLTIDSFQKETLPTKQHDEKYVDTASTEKNNNNRKKDPKGIHRLTQLRKKA